MSFVSLQFVYPLFCGSLVRFLKNCTKCAILIWKECERNGCKRMRDKDSLCQRNSSLQSGTTSSDAWRATKKGICVYDGFGSKVYDSTDWIELILNEHLLDFILFPWRILFFFSHKNAKHAVPTWLVVWHWGNNLNRMDIEHYFSFPMPAIKETNCILHIAYFIDSDLVSMAVKMILL